MVRASGSRSPQASLAPLDDVERCYWSSQAFQRCLRATKWDYMNGLKRAEETLVWRREFKVEQMKEEDVSREGETGKELVFGFDNDCRPVLYMVSRFAGSFPATENTQLEESPLLSNSTRTVRTRKQVRIRSHSSCGVSR